MTEGVGGTVGRPGSLPRRILKLGSLLFARFTRLLERVSPRLNDLLGAILERAYQLQRRSMITRGIAQGRVITVQVEGTRFRLCLVAGHEITHPMYLPLGNPYEPVATACLTRLLQRLPSPTFMDVGAFIGFFTCYGAALLKDERPVFAVESNPSFCDAIQRAVALNGFTRVRVLQAALSDQSGVVTIDDTAVVPANEPAPGRLTVDATTLDDVCARESIGPTIVKIDVHGGEGKVLRGMSRVLQETVQIVLLELHALSFYKPHSPNVTRLELLDWLEQFGFSLFHVAGHRSERESGMATYLEQGRFAYTSVTPQTRQLLLFDRPLDVLIIASKNPDLAPFLGPSVDLSTAVG